MKYNNIKKAQFLSRPNRFIANILIDGEVQIAHVKNTGRCKELLTPYAGIFVEEFDSIKRKTKYDVISVYKGNRLINMDSQVPNKVVGEWLAKGNLIENITLIKPEKTYGKSRFDFYIETPTRKIFLEVKGVTLEENRVVKFPDAPTERGIKHINELCSCIEDGYEAYVVFVIQMQDVDYFTPNITTHKAFSDALINAKNKGVNIVAIDCFITENSITAKDFVEVVL